ncbi:hypothetical protein [Aeromonas hydrophila]|uniref:hypothetical protein n=1 Tax=Aeromonas hydrophila TaxID=644 RepID=UPI002B485FFA|nr:hypothetical protein [Aeromonas hydrophila]
MLESIFYLSHALYNKIKSNLFIIGLSVFLSTAIIVYSTDLKYMKVSDILKLFPISETESLVIIFIIMVLVFTAGLSYLQSGVKSDIKTPEKNLSSITSLHKKIASQDEEIKNLKDKIESFSSQYSLSPEEKVALLHNIADGTRKEIIEDVFNMQVHELKSHIKYEAISERIKDSALDISLRLEREIRDLRLRSNINLMIGMIITLSGLLLLWSLVGTVDSSELLKALASEGDESNSQFIKNLILPLIPRIMLVFFVEIFAYFFLRLYKNCLNEIKYFQNELTNVESRIVALELAHSSKNNEAISSVIASLVATERNFILQRGETTVELEKAKSESDMMRKIISAIPNLFKK